MTNLTEDVDLPVTRPIEREPTHPGELFAEILETLKLSVAEAAVRMRVTRQALYAVLSGDSAVSADMALKFASLVRGDPDLFIQMQASRDLWLARRRLGDVLAMIEPVVEGHAGR